MNKIARRCVFCTVSKHDKLDLRVKAEASPCQNKVQLEETCHLHYPS